uniref:Uncharacterized protein n=1 Tax=Glossina pallidipes TaxID=7398 RepID=A0A1A9ZWS7_GLOPL
MYRRCVDRVLAVVNILKKCSSSYFKKNLCIEATCSPLTKIVFLFTLNEFMIFYWLTWFVAASSRPCKMPLFKVARDLGDIEAGSKLLIDDDGLTAISLQRKASYFVIVTCAGNSLSMSKTVRSSASVAFRSIPALSSVFTTDSLPHKAASCKAEPEGVNKFTLTPAATKTSTTGLWPLRLARCKQV